MRLDANATIELEKIAIAAHITRVPSVQSKNLTMSADAASSPQLNSALQTRNVGGVRRRAQASKDSSSSGANRPNSTRAAGAGGSSNTMLRIYTDDSKGLTVDPVVVLVLAISFVLSVVLLHIVGKLARWFYK